MPDPEEVAFRDVERRLDDLLSEARSGLEAEGIKITDRSARYYHYKNQDLIWSIELQRNWLHFYEHARVTVEIAYSDFLCLDSSCSKFLRQNGPAIVRISRRSEVFRQ